MSKINCNNINYRKGYVEVEADIHDGCINLEVTNIHPDVDITGLDLGCDEIPDESVVGNTEIELNLDEAEKLVSFLQEAILGFKKKRP